MSKYNNKLRFSPSMPCGRYALLLLAAIPIAAYPLSLSDYLNQSTVTASADQFEEITANNTDQIQITPNAELTVVKQVTNDNGGALGVADFGVDSDAGSLIFDTGVVAGDVTTFTSATLYLAPGTYSLTEADVAGYSEGTWSCTTGTMGTTAFNAGEVTLAFGEQTVCSIANDDVGPTLALTKTLVTDDGGLKTIEDFDISINSSEVISGAANAVLANTAITISELDLPGYTEGTWACTDSTGLTTGLPTTGLATGEAITLKPGSIVDCAISNNDIAPLLTLVKTVDNGDGGLLAIADFEISIDTAIVDSGVANTVRANEGIDISELDLPGYTEGTWSCLDANALTTTFPAITPATGTQVTLLPGSDVTCSIVNDDIAPKLTLVKNVVNDNGGNLDIDDFDISIGTLEVASGVATTQLANSNITISELDLPSYAEGTWSCVDASALTAGLPAAGAATGTTFAMLPGADVTCTISNNDLGIDLSIVKSVDDFSPNIGQTITFTLSVENAGPDIATDVTVNDVVPAGFTYVGSTIAGGTASDDSDPAGAGLSWTISSVPVGTPFELSFDAVVNAP